jgi:hypothetical protein
VTRARRLRHHRRGWQKGLSDTEKNEDHTQDEGRHTWPFTHGVTPHDPRRSRKADIFSSSASLTGERQP